MAVKEVCVISGRGVYSRRTGVQGGKGSDINLTNDEEEGFSATRSFFLGGGGSFNLDAGTCTVT